MKNKSLLTAPLFVSVIFILIPISEKLLALSASQPSDVILSGGLVQLFAFAVPTAFYCRLRGLDLSRHTKLRGVSASDLPFVLSAALTYFLAAILLLYLQLKLAPTAQITTVQSAVSFSDISPTATALTYVIIPAIAEELFFRSVILSDYSPLGAPSAVIISALFFAMLHFSFADFIIYFILGVILAMITYVTDSSLPSVIIHLVNNTVVIFFGDSAGEFLKASSSSVILAFILAAAFLLSLTAMISSLEDIYERRSYLYEKGTLPGSRREAIRSSVKIGKIEAREEKKVPTKAAALLSPTFLFCILVFIMISLDII